MFDLAKSIEGAASRIIEHPKVRLQIFELEDSPEREVRVASKVTGLYIARSYCRTSYPTM